MTATRSDVVGILRMHGLTGHAAASLWAISQALVRNTRRRGVEYSALIDAQSGLQVGPTIGGSRHRIDVRPQITETSPRGRYAHVHTHPGSSSFSDVDAGFLLTWHQVKVVTVAAADGRWYVMSRAVDIGAPAPLDAVTAFRAELLNLVDDPRVIASERPHEIWTRIAGSLELRYDRVGSSET